MTVRQKEAGDRTADRVRAVLASRDLTLHQVAATSARIYGSNSPFHIPHTLYHSLGESATFGPSLAQTCALSHITSYRLEDWLAVLGIDLSRIAEIEAGLPMQRTRLLQSPDRVEPRMGVPQFKGTRPPASVLPLGPILRWSSHTSVKAAERRSLFARIGSEDAFAWPELLPGSIVRVDPEPATVTPDRGAPPLRLIEHERGFWCGRFHVSENGTIHVAARELAYAQTALRTPQEAVIVGVVDMEIRWLRRFERPTIPTALSRYQIPRPLNRSAAGLGKLVRQARGRAGLTLERASLLSREISQYLGSAQYAIAQSTLSEYEAQDVPPRHLEKVMTLCLLYGIRLNDFVAASGTAHGELGQQALPANLLPQRPLQGLLGEQQENPSQVYGTTISLTEEIGEIPWFLAGSLQRTSGLSQLSVRDFYWISGTQPFLPAYTRGSMLALVDRRKKKPVRLPDRPLWQQPAWVLIDRSGEHRCACCSLEGDNLVLYPESDKTRSPEVLLRGSDAELVGQIVAVARRIPTRWGVRSLSPAEARGEIEES